MGANEHEQDPQKPSEQRGGTTPDEAEAREKGEWGEPPATAWCRPSWGVGCAARDAGRRP